MKNNMYVITGPTACGKTGKSVELARIINAEIISADSRQVYTRMDIGTGKDLEEYGDIPYHLIDIVPAGSKYNLHDYLSDFEKAEADILSRGKNIIVCGGTGLYLESAISGIRLPKVEKNEELRKSLQGKSIEELTKILCRYKSLHNTTDVDNCQRAIRAIEIEEYYVNHPEERKNADKEYVNPRECKIFLLDISRDLRREKISKRLKSRLDNGMVEEVDNLIKSGIKPEDLIYYGLEYKYITLYLIGEMNYKDMLERLEIEIHKFAKRQMTWFRGMERRGYELIHIPYDLPVSEYPL